MSKEILNYIPHRRTMVLIDRIINKDKDRFAVEVKVDENSLLYSKKGVPSYCAIEYMAQSVAAYSSLFLERNKNASKVGFIVSIRAYKCSRGFFQMNENLKVLVKPIMVVSNSGTFNCEIMIGDEQVSKARITAYVPSELELEKMKKDKI